MSLDDVARETNMSVERVAHIENDEMVPSIVECVVLAESVGVSTSKLMGVTGRVNRADVRCSHPESELMAALIEMLEIDAMLVDWVL